MMTYRYQHGIIGLLCVLLGGMLFMCAPAQAAKSPVQAEYLLIRNQFATIEGVLYKQPGSSARIGLVITHPFAGTSTRSLLCPELAAEGFDILCFNNRFSNNQQLNTDWENIALDVAAAVQEMRDRGYRNVVIYGHSAGGPTMAYYQNVAERGNAAFKGGNTLTGFLGFFNSDASEKRLPPADGVMLAAPSTGLGASVLLRYDGSVINEETAERDPNLDIYNPANGYVPGFGADSIYTPEFLVSYYAAQCARMNAKIDAAQARLAAIQAGGERFTDNDWFIVPAIRAYPAYTDFDVNRATDAAFLKLPSGDTEVVVRQSITLGPFRDPQNRSTGGARVHTLTGFLALRAIRCGNTHPESHATMPFNPEGVTPETSGIDWDSTNNTAVGNLMHVSVPTLIVQGMADTSIYPRSAELIYNAAAATDKTLIFIEGATHSFTTAGGFDIDVPAVTVQALTDWLWSRFP